MSESDAPWCWRCNTRQQHSAVACATCGGELHSSQPPTTTAMSHETLQIDLSGMEPAARDMFLLFLDGADIRHELQGFLLSISASDEQRTRDLLETITADTLVELDPAEPVDDTQWSRSVAAMMHPSARAAAPSEVAPTGRRVAAALVSYVVWWLAVVIAYAIASVFITGEPSYTVTLVVSSIPLIGEVWLTAVYGTTPGKYLLEMRIENMNGAVPGWASSIVRAAVMNWPILVAYAPGVIGQVAITVVPFWMVFLIVTIARDPHHQGWHDHVAHTRVVMGRHPVDVDG